MNFFSSLDRRNSKQGDHTRVIDPYNDHNLPDSYSRSDADNQGKETLVRL